MKKTRKYNLILLNCLNFTLYNNKMFVQYSFFVHNDDEDDDDVDSFSHICTMMLKLQSVVYKSISTLKILKLLWIHYLITSDDEKGILFVESFKI